MVSVTACAVVNTKPHWTEIDSAAGLSLSKTGDIRLDISKETTPEEREKAMAELIARKERERSMTNDWEHARSEFFKSGPYTLVTEKGEVKHLLEDVKGDSGALRVRRHAYN